MADGEADLQDASARLLADALTKMLGTLRDNAAVRAFVDAHSEMFFDYVPGGEFLLEWTDVHHGYVELVERAIVSELEVLGCSEDALLDHALNGGLHLQEDKRLGRLLAKIDFEAFCAMMHANAHGGMDDDDEEYAFVEDEDGVDEVEDDVEDEGLDELQNALAHARIDPQQQLDESSAFEEEPPRHAAEVTTRQPRGRRW